MTHTASRATIGMKGGAARDPVVYPVAAYSTAFRSGQTPEMTTAPHGASCAGFSFAPGVFRGLFALCLICHFNAPVRRFNYGRYPYIPPRSVCAVRLVYGLVAWRCTLRRTLPLCGVLPACRHRAPPLCHWRGGWPLHAGRGFWWWRASLPKSLS